MRKYGMCSLCRKCIENSLKNMEILVLIINISTNIKSQWLENTKISK